MNFTNSTSSSTLGNAITSLPNKNRIFAIQQVNATNYSGSVIKLRRSTDNATADFTTDSATNLNLVTTSGGIALSTWLGGGTAYVDTWYDQSGNGRNLTQANTALQPTFSATTGVQFRTAKYMQFADNGTLTDATFFVGFIQNSYLYGQPTFPWYLQDGIIPNELPGATDDWGLILPGAGLFGMGLGSSDVMYSISTNGLGNYSFMTATRASSSGQVKFYKGTGAGSGFSMDTGTKIGTTPCYMGYNSPGNMQYMDADIATMFWFDDVKSDATISTIASRFSTQKTIPSATSKTYITASPSVTTKINIFGAPLFANLSLAARNSAVGVYSLKSVNSINARVVQLNKTISGPTVVTNWPPVAFTGTGSTGAWTSSTVYGTFIASASSELTPGYEAWLAFNKITADPGGEGYSWATNQSTLYSTNGVVGVWIQIQCPVSLTLSSTTMYGRSSDLGQNASEIYLFGSNDGSTWTQLLGATATTFQSSSAPNTFTVGATISYTYFRVVCTQPTGTGFMAMGEIYLTGTISGGSSIETQDFYSDKFGNLYSGPNWTGQTASAWLAGATGNVSVWYDQSGLGNNATQPFIDYQPTINLTNSIINFDGITTLFDLPDGTVPSGSSNYTISLKHRTLSTSLVSNIIGGGTSFTSTGSNYISYVPPSAGTEGYYNNWRNLRAGGGTYAINNKITAKFDNTVGRTIYVNGTSVATDALVSRSSTRINNSIGRYGGYLTGELYSIFIFNTALSSSDQALVEQYL